MSETTSANEAGTLQGNGDNVHSTAGNDALTTTEATTHRFSTDAGFQLHPGFTTLLTCAVLFLLLFIYLWLEPKVTRCSERMSPFNRQYTGPAFQPAYASHLYPPDFGPTGAKLGPRGDNGVPLGSKALSRLSLAQLNAVSRPKNVARLEEGWKGGPDHKHLIYVTPSTPLGDEGKEKSLAQ